MKVAIMQPYIFPYIGYYQLINTVDKFIFYDDVHYIKRGWINRNQILINNDAHLFTIPVLKASQNKLINEIELGLNEKWLKQFFITLEQNYKKAPYYQPTITLIKSIFNQPHQTISDLAIASVKEIANHIGISSVFELSSKKYAKTKGMDKADRLIAICKANNANYYINPSGGVDIYDPEYFSNQDIKLNFIKNNITTYNQFNNKFVGGLSIIDVLMFNSKEQVNNMLTNYSLKS